MPFVNAGDVRLHYRVVGDGPRSLVFVHGNLSSCNWWDLVVREPLEGCTAYVFDLRGCGLSDKPEPEPGYANYSFDRMALDLVEALRQLGCGPYEVVGHSTGGLIGLRLLTASDSQCTGYFGLDPAGVRGVDLSGRMGIFQRARNDPEFAYSLIASTMTSLFDDIDLTGERPPRPSSTTSTDQLELVGRLAAQRHTASDGIWFGVARHLTAEADSQPMRPLLSSIRVPMTIVWGELDAWITEESMAELASLVPHCRLIRVPGIGQSLQVEAPEVFRRLLREHLDHAN